MQIPWNWYTICSNSCQKLVHSTNSSEDRYAVSLGNYHFFINQFILCLLFFYIYSISFTFVDKNHLSFHIVIVLILGLSPIGLFIIFRDCRFISVVALFSDCRVLSPFFVINDCRNSSPFFVIVFIYNCLRIFCQLVSIQLIYLTFMYVTYIKFIYLTS